MNSFLEGLTPEQRAAFTEYMKLVTEGFASVYATLKVCTEEIERWRSLGRYEDVVKVIKFAEAMTVAIKSHPDRDTLFREAGEHYQLPGTAARRDRELEEYLNKQMDGIDGWGSDNIQTE